MDDGPLFGGDEQLQLQLQRALALSSAYLNRRERTVSEVRLHLCRKGIAEDRIEAAIRELADLGLVDDVRFARLFVSDKRELEQWGSERIRRGLLSRGIDRGVVEEALASPTEASDSQPTELERALELLRRRYPVPPEDRRQRDRALGVLLRKGYESELALDALAAYARDD